MKKKLCLLALVLSCLLIFTGCFCDHEFADADCVTPKTCSKCGNTEGEALGHTWVDADCVTPKTCSACKLTEGEALGHTWVDADCVTPKTCSVCNATEGEALGHAWQDATTETAQTCSACSITEGERIITDPRFTTASTKAIHGKWQGVLAIGGKDLGAMMGMDSVDGEMRFLITLDFNNDGTCNLLMDLEDPEAYKQLMVDVTVQVLYASFEQEGMNKEQADAAFEAAYNMSIEDYVVANVGEIDTSAARTEAELVYYVEGNNLHTSSSWSATFEDTGVIGDNLITLVIPADAMAGISANVELKPVTE